jgi:predicted dehydrogenase
MPAKAARLLRVGVLGAADIAVRKVVPAMQLGEHTEVVAIASRDLEKARAAAGTLGIARAYGSYEELLDDAEVDAVYNPLPNHLHVPWTTKAAEAGKHVLCEKPIGRTAAEARALLDVRDRTGVRIEEAFMVRSHPQWIGAIETVRSGRIGRVRSVSGHFSYFNRDTDDIRNQTELGGGAMLDIGSYLVLAARLVYGEEPSRAVARVERDPDFETDVVASAILDFPTGAATVSCSTQQAPYQRVIVFGERGVVEIEIPFNAPPDHPCRVLVDGEAIEFPVVDQYTAQGDRFARAVLDGTPGAMPLEDSIANLAVVDAIFESGRTEGWVPIG